MNELLNIDCIEYMKSMPSNSVDMILTFDCELNKEYFDAALKRLEEN